MDEYTCLLFLCSKPTTAFISYPNLDMRYAAAIVALLLIPAMQ